MMNRANLLKKNSHRFHRLHRSLGMRILLLQKNLCHLWNLWDLKIIHLWDLIIIHLWESLLQKNSHRFHRLHRSLGMRIPLQKKNLCHLWNLWDLKIIHLWDLKNIHLWGMRLLGKQS